jgi:hypothetical protein
MLQTNSTALLLNALEGAIEMIGAADYRLAFRRKTGNDERQNVSYGSEADLSVLTADVRSVLYRVSN